MTTDNFRPDLNNPPSTPWNQSCAEIFTVDYCTRVHPGYRNLKRVKDAYIKYFKNLSRRWRIQVSTPEYREQIKVANRRDQRKNALFQRRLEMCILYTRNHIDILERLGPNMMSSDESDMEMGCERILIKQKPCRNPILTKWLRTYDALYRRHRRLGGHTSSSQGALPQVRLVSDKVDTGRYPPKHLPANAYCPNFLTAIGTIGRSELKAGPNYNFTHTEAIDISIQGYLPVPGGPDFA